MKINCRPARQRKCTHKRIEKRERDKKKQKTLVLYYLGSLNDLNLYMSIKYVLYV